MTLKNKLGIHNAVELSRQEERLSKQRALELFDEGLLDTFEIGTFAASKKATADVSDAVVEEASQSAAPETEAPKAE